MIQVSANNFIYCLKVIPSNFKICFINCFSIKFVMFSIPNHKTLFSIGDKYLFDLLFIVPSFSSSFGPYFNDSIISFHVNRPNVYNHKERKSIGIQVQFPFNTLYLGFIFPPINTTFFVLSFFK